MKNPLKIKISREFIDGLGFESGLISQIQLNFIYKQTINSIASTIKATCRYLNVPKRSNVIEGEVNEKEDFTWG